MTRANITLAWLLTSHMGQTNSKSKTAKWVRLLPIRHKYVQLSKTKCKIPKVGDDLILTLKLENCVLSNKTREKKKEIVIHVQCIHASLASSESMSISSSESLISCMTGSCAGGTATGGARAGAAGVGGGAGRER